MIINIYDEDFAEIDVFQILSWTDEPTFSYKTYMTLNNKDAYQSFKAYTKSLRKYVGYYDTNNQAFRDFLSALSALLNARLKLQIINIFKVDRYFRMISFDIHKT